MGTALPTPRSLPALAIAPLLLAALVLPLDAQEESPNATAPETSSSAENGDPEIFFACYVPGSGTVYRVGVPGTRPECSGRRHVEFRWTDGVPGHLHGALLGLDADDHPQYLLIDGTRPLGGELDAGGHRITGLAAGVEAGDAVTYEQAVKAGDAAEGDLGGSYPAPTVEALRGNPVSDVAPATDDVLTWDGDQWAPAAVSGGSGTSDHGSLAGLGDDDHDQYLLTDGVRRATDGFAVTGARGAGSIPASGAGVRLMWYPGKAAFRAGQVRGGDANQWDDTNVGGASVAFGVNTTASGFASTALGWFTRAGGPTSTAMGFASRARGESSTAMGDQALATGLAATAMGQQTHAEGDWSTAMGQGTTASGDRSTAMGWVTQATGDFSTAMGAETKASGDHSTAMGFRADSDDHRGAFVYGDFTSFTDVRASADNQFVVRAQHFWLGTDNSVSDPSGHFLTTSTGAHLTTGGVWTNASSRSTPKRRSRRWPTSPSPAGATRSPRRSITSGPWRRTSTRHSGWGLARRAWPPWTWGA